MNYNELKQQVQDYLETAEATFVTNIPNFVQVVETRLYTDPTAPIPALRRNIAGTMDVGNQYLGTPEDFLSSYSLAVYDPAVGEYSYCMLKDANLIREMYPNPSLRGIPKYYGMFDHNTFIFGPTPDKAYSVELHYHYLPESLVTAGSTWLSQNFPSVLLYGVIAEGYRFLKGDAAQQKVYDDQFMQALSVLRAYSGARVRTDAYANNQAKPVTQVGE
jgi:hypothetical protein